MPNMEHAQDDYGNWLPLLPLDLPEPARLPPPPLPQDDFMQPIHQNRLMSTGIWRIAPLETSLTPVPPNSLNFLGSSPAIELQGTDSTVNGSPAPAPSMTTLWNDAWIGPSVLAWDQPAGSSVATVPEVLEKVEPAISPSQLELAPALSTSQSETTSRSSGSPSQRVRFGIPSRGSRASESPSRGLKDGRERDNLNGRDRHNRVEKSYRSRLNSRFLGLLKVLLKDQTSDNPRLGGKFEALSRGAVLDMASERIESLEAENHLLQLKLKTYGTTV